MKIIKKIKLNIENIKFKDIINIINKHKNGFY